MNIRYLFREPEFLPMRGRGAFCGLVALYTQRYCCFMPFDFQKFIERNPQVCAGEAVIRGTRVTVRTILASLAEGAPVEEIVADFPTVSRDAVRAIIAYAAASAEEDIPVSPLPSLA
ncbi:MAG: DUF433 domain-containing protein [Verrucomicrobiota bacterium]